MGGEYEGRQAFFRLDKAKLVRCFAPGMDCEEVAIQAHSIQNAKRLEMLSRNGHVIKFTRRMEPDGPKIDFGPVGRNQATTFTGLCAAHDRKLFAPIETEPLDAESPRHLFLLAYRAVLRELHASCEAAAKIQSSYQHRVKAGLDPKGQPSPAGMYAVERMMVAYETHLYKSRYDSLLEQEDFDGVKHDVIHIDGAPPSIGASAMFSLDHVPVRDDVARVCLTILPLSSNSTVVLFSYLEADAPHARAALSRILESSGSHQLYEISREVLHSCENFVISPDLFDSWTPQKRARMRDFFQRTLFRNDRSIEHEDLFLFWPNSSD